MNAYKNGKSFRLLPNYFKWIGLSMILLTILFLVLAKVFNNELFQNNKNTIKIFCLDLLVTGLFLIAVTKDKIEDELTLLLRFKSMSLIFLAAVVYVITQPIFDRIWGEAITVVSSQHLVVIMLVAYLVCFFILKKMR